MKTIGFIGSGNMAQALIRAIVHQYNVISSDIDKNKLKKLEKELKIKTTHNNKEIEKKSDIIFIAVKPQIINSVLAEIKNTKKLVISIAAGITLKTLESNLPNARIIRVMPNTPCLVNEMAAAYSLGKKATKIDETIAHDILSSAGLAIKLNESKLDAVTALSGSGPAFVARLIEAFTDAGIKQGLDKETAYELTLQTFSGTAKLLKKQNLSPKELIEMVTSPKGTTFAGLQVLDKSNIKEIIEKTIAAAKKRSEELGK